MRSLIALCLVLCLCLATAHCYSPLPSNLALLSEEIDVRDMLKNYQNSFKKVNRELKAAIATEQTTRDVVKKYSELNKLKKAIVTLNQFVQQQTTMGDELEMSDAGKKSSCVPTGMFSLARLMGQRCRSTRY